MEIYKKGSRGEMVVQIQNVLHLYPDGIFGELTREAVTAWQREHGLTADGIVGPATLAKMFPAVAQSALGLKKSKRKITDIVVHCTATPEGKDYNVGDIRRIHIKDKGWADIGYHYVVRIDGTIEPGRDVNIIGAHVSGYNSHSIGVVYVGGVEGTRDARGRIVAKTDSRDKPIAKDTRTEAQKNALLRLLMDLKKLYPGAVIKGHRDYSPDKNHNGIIEPKEWIKSCPCFDAPSEYRNV